jgi:basic membrane lipoprotein Med (substrate-binding protein (PBP1-ABC) superfamily)
MNSAGRRQGFGRAVATCVFALLLLAGCSCDDDARKNFRVGLLTSGSVQDAGWHQSAYQGLERLRDELGAEVVHQVANTPQEAEAAFRDLAERGFNLVFGHGLGFADAAVKVGRSFTRTVFITTDESAVLRNVSPIIFEVEEVSYVLGYVAGAISRRAHVAAVGGVEVPQLANAFYAFTEGAVRARPRVKTSVSYSGSWTDDSAARSATAAQIAEGADVLIHYLGDAADGFFQAVKESEDVVAFGTDSNQQDLAPGAVLASINIDVAEAFMRVAKEVKSGQFWPRAIRYGMRSGMIGIEWNEALASEVPAQVMNDAEALAGRIKRGAFEVPGSRF